MTTLFSTTLLAARDGDWGHHPWGLLLLLAAAIGLVAWLLVRRRRSAGPYDSARELAVRYVRGEATEAELRERLDDLRRSLGRGNEGRA